LFTDVAQITREGVRTVRKYEELHNQLTKTLFQ